MTNVLRVIDKVPVPVEPTTMEREGLSEPRHLEPWLVAHIEVIDPTLKVVTTQFNQWTAASRSSAERLDILALAQSGELVVVELKRGTDRSIHLQGISYGALVAGFTTEALAEAHAEWLTKHRSAPVSVDDARAELLDHLDDTDWTDEILQQIRIVLVAEQFPPLVLTTVRWLSDRAPELAIECHQYTLFKDDGGLMMTFDRLYPVNDLSDQLLAPTTGGTTAAKRVATKRRQARSVVLIHKSRLIPVGASIDLALASRVKPEVAELVDAWLDADPARRDVRWLHDANRPLHWAARPDVEAWTPSALRNEIFELAEAPEPKFSAADAWSYRGENLYTIASRSVDDLA